MTETQIDAVHNRYEGYERDLRRLRGALERARPVLVDAHADLNQRINDGERATQMELALFSDLCAALREIDAALKEGG